MKNMLGLLKANLFCPLVKQSVCCISFFLQRKPGQQHRRYLTYSQQRNPLPKTNFKYQSYEITKKPIDYVYTHIILSMNIHDNRLEAVKQYLPSHDRLKGAVLIFGKPRPPAVISHWKYLSYATSLCYPCLFCRV